MVNIYANAYDRSFLFNLFIKSKETYFWSPLIFDMCHYDFLIKGYLLRYLFTVIIVFTSQKN